MKRIIASILVFALCLQAAEFDITISQKKADGNNIARIVAPDANGVLTFTAGKIPSSTPQTSFAMVGAANLFTAAQSIDKDGAANTPAFSIIGVPFSGGTSTTTKPWLLLEADGAPTANWNTNGTGIGVNFSSTQSTSALLIDLQRDGTRVFSVNGTGDATAAGNITGVNLNASNASGWIQWNGRSVLRSPADGQITLLNAAENDFSRLNLGGVTSSFPAVKRSGATLQIVLADDSGFAGMQTLYHRFGSGSPEGAVTAPVGTIYHRTDGSTGTVLYVKSTGTGNTGWNTATGGMVQTLIDVTIDGGGSAITTGTLAWIEMPSDCTITGYSLKAKESGSAVIDIYVEPDPNDGSGIRDNPAVVADSITAAAKPTLSSQSGKTVQSAGLTGWDTSITAGSEAAIAVDSASTITWLQVKVFGTKP